jgi:hypothetical protein
MRVGEVNKKRMWKFFAPVQNVLSVMTPIRDLEVGRRLAILRG